eukprot:449037_1
MNESLATSWWRWVICIIICANAIQFDVTRDILVPIQDQLIDWYNINPVKYNLLLTLYSWPNIVCSIAFGMCVDKFGVRKMLSLAWLLDIIGVLLMVYSCYLKHYILLCIGRSIVGIGNEGLSLSLKLYAISFFHPNEYGRVFGIYLAFGSIGVASHTFITYQIYLLFGILYAISIPLIIAPFVCILLFTTMIVEKYIYSSTETQKLITTKADKSRFKLSDIKHFSIYYYLLLIGYILFTGARASSGNIRISFIHHMFG